MLPKNQFDFIWSDLFYQTKKTDVVGLYKCTWLISLSRNATRSLVAYLVLALLTHLKELSQNESTAYLAE